MKDLKIDKGDLIFVSDDLAVVEEADELRQTVYIGMQTNQGEWFLDPDMGIRHAVFVGKKPNVEEMRAEIIRGAMQDERIQTVDEIEINRDTKNRKVSVSFQATAAGGEVVGGGVEINA